MMAATANNALSLTLSSDTLVDSAIAAMRESRQITSFHVVLGEPRASETNLLAIFSAVEDFESLKHLHFCPSRCCHNTSPALPVQALTTALLRAPRLAYLSLQDVGICGHEISYSSLSSAFRNLKMLRHVCLSGCLPADGTTSLEPLIYALAEVPTLEEVMISNTMLSVLGNRTLDTLELLCHRSKNLEFLVLKMLPELQDCQLAAFIDLSMRNNRTIKRFTMHSFEIGPKTCLSIAKMLKVNKTMARLDISLCTCIDAALPIIEALQTPTSNLKELLFQVDMFQYGGNRKRFLDCVLQTVKVNYVLTDIRGIAWGPIHTDIPFYLDLNRLGRKQFFSECSSSTKEQVLHALISSCGDTRVAYYLLSEFPSLCNIPCYTPIHGSS